ncbi:MAG: phosphoribosylformylglycinamidine synthase [Bacteroidia bacterium]|nr:phosphoribosylformylglycinamidine synthase [Bacteroidia bacterium]
MNIQKYILFFFLFINSVVVSQSTDTCFVNKDVLDSLYINETEGVKGIEKVLHAEPLYIDLIRDLGARKGEKEWNIGMGLTDNYKFDRYTALVEYEFAPIDRLGLEIELPFSFYYPANSDVSKDSIPRSQLNSLKLAAQYSIYVSEKNKTSIAIGYINEFELVDFKNYGKSKTVNSNIYNPFLVAAKRFGDNFHTLIYTGPTIEQSLINNHIHTIWQINTNFHYMISGTRNFIGLEFNKEISNNDFDMIIRPQMRLAVADNLMVGIVAGIPINRENERFSSFLRLIYEPGHKKSVH